jgi:hypothetical protein
MGERRSVMSNCVPWPVQPSNPRLGRLILMVCALAKEVVL